MSEHECLKSPQLKDERLRLENELINVASDAVEKHIDKLVEIVESNQLVTLVSQFRDMLNLLRTVQDSIRTLNGDLTMKNQNVTLEREVLEKLKQKLDTL